MTNTESRSYVNRPYNSNNFCNIINNDISGDKNNVVNVNVNVNVNNGNSNSNSNHHSPLMMMMMTISMMTMKMKTTIAVLLKHLPLQRQCLRHVHLRHQLHLISAIPHSAVAAATVVAAVVAAASVAKVPVLCS
jgi:hypothetical protein